MRRGRGRSASGGGRQTAWRCAGWGAPFSLCGVCMWANWWGSAGSVRRCRLKTLRNPSTESKDEYTTVRGAVRNDAQSDNARGLGGRTCGSSDSERASWPRRESWAGAGSGVANHATQKLVVGARPGSARPLHPRPYTRSPSSAHTLNIRSSRAGAPADRIEAYYISSGRTGSSVFIRSKVNRIDMVLLRHAVVLVAKDISPPSTPARLHECCRHLHDMV